MKLWRRFLSLEMVSETLAKVLDNIYYWKWALIALENALQGYMVLALKGTSSINVLKEKCAQKFEAAWERGDEVLPKRETRYISEPL